MKKREYSFNDLKEDNLVCVEKYQETQKNVWDKFVANSNNGTIFHTRRFLNYHPPKRFNDSSLIFKKGEKWLSVLPAAINEIDSKRHLISHPGSSMAGPVFKLSTSIKDTFFIVEKLVEFAQQNNVDSIKLTLPPLIYHARPGNYFDFVLSSFGFEYQKREVSSVIPLDFAEEDTLSVFSSESRRAVRRAIKMGVTFSESDDFETFYKMLNQNLKLRHNVQPTHSLEELLALKQKFPDKIQLYAAMANDEMVAGLVVFDCNERVALAFYISHNEKRQEFRGVNFLFYEFIKKAISKNVKYLDFGIFTVNMKPNWGLARFKESFGALGVFRDTLVKRI